MNKVKAVTIIFFLICIFVSQGYIFAIEKVGDEFLIQSKYLNLVVSSQSGAIKTRLSDQDSPWGNPFTIYEEKENNSKLLFEKPNEVFYDGEKIICKYNHPLGVKVVQEFWEQEGYISTKLTVNNTGSEQKWFRIAANLPLLFQDDTINYWDGLKVKKQFVGQDGNNQLPNTFPAAAAYNLNSGMAVGFEVYQLFSYIENNIVYNDSDKNLSYGMKLAINGGDSQSIEFIYFGFKPDYGYLNAIDSYYKFYPAAFKQHPNIDPRVSESITGHIVYSRGFDKVRREAYRRLDSGITWFYAPFKKAGQFWLTDEEEYNREVPNQPASYYNISMEEYKTGIIGDAKRTYIDGFLPMYYIINWCEEELAHRRYPDAILKSPDGTPVRKYPWVKGWTADLAMWWWDNAFAEETKKDLRLIVEETDIGGFAIDCSAGKLKARNQTGFDSVPGVAYDNLGIYSEESVGVALMMDFIHTLDKDGKTMATWANPNGPFPYYSGIRTDTALIEKEMSELIQYGEILQPMRYLLGTKPIHPYSMSIREKFGKVFPWKLMSAEEIRELYRVFWDKTLLVSFKYGVFPGSDFFWGYPRAATKIQELTTVVSSGWEPIPAFEVNQDTWNSRYGRDLDAYLYIGNPQVRNLKISSRIDNPYIGDGTYFFNTFDGQKIKNEVRNGKTVIDFELEPNQYKVLKSIAKVDLDCDMVGYIQEIGDKAKLKVCFFLEVEETQIANIIIKVPEDGTVYSVTLNDHPISFNQEEGSVVFTTELYSNINNTMAVSWESNIFLSPADNIKKYHFVTRDYKPNCTIVTMDQVDEWDQSSAERIQAYFKFYYKEVMNKDVVIPVKKFAEANGSDFHIIIKDDPCSTGTIQLVDNDIIITGPDSITRYSLVEKLMRLLDEQYPYWGKIGQNTWYPKDPDTIQMREKAGLGAGGILE